MKATNVLKFIFCLVLLASPPTSVADIVVDVGEHRVAPSSGQLISIFVVSNDTANDPDVTGINVKAQLGDGLGALPEPIFQAVDFTAGMWDGYDNTVVGGPVNGAEQFVQASVVFDESGRSQVADGLLVSFLIDATGFSSGDVFDLKLVSTQIGSDTDFVLAGGSSFNPTISNGRITVSSVPEPSSLASIGLLFLVSALRRKRPGRPAVPRN